MDPKTHSVFLRLRRDGDPSSDYNRKLIAAANAAANELCRRVALVFKRNSYLTRRGAWSCGDAGWYVFASGGTLFLAQTYVLRGVTYHHEYGGGLCHTVEDARALARDIAGSTLGPEQWLRGRINFLCAEYGLRQ